jgi:hypothetical protein
VDGRDERRAGEKNSAGGRQLCFKGEQRGGGGWVGAVWRQSGRERGREVGATVEDGGVGATWDGVADRWAGNHYFSIHILLTTISLLQNRDEILKIILNRN